MKPIQRDSPEGREPVTPPGHVPSAVQGAPIQVVHWIDDEWIVRVDCACGARVETSAADSAADHGARPPDSGL